MTEQTTETPEDGVQEPQETPEGTETPTEAPEDAQEPQEGTEDEPETFPRSYVVKLRDEAAKHRQRAADRDDLAGRLHTSLVAATGRLADPDDLPFDEAHLDDEDALTAALDALLARKPHLASRRVSGDVGQGHTGGDTAVDLAGMLRARV